MVTLASTPHLAARLANINMHVPSPDPCRASAESHWLHESKLTQTFSITPRISRDLLV